MGSPEKGLGEKVMHRAQVDTDKGVQGRDWDEKPGGRWASTLKNMSV